MIGALRRPLRWIARPRRVVSLILTAVLVAAIGTLLWQARTLTRQADDIRAARSDSLTWLVAQVEVEFLRFKAALLAADATDPALGLAQASRGFDIFYSRAMLFDPEILGFRRPDNDRVLSSLERMRDRTQALADTFDTASPDALPALHAEAIAQAEALDTMVRNFAMEALEIFIARETAARVQQTALTNRFATLAILVVVLLSALLVLIVDLYRDVAARARAMRRVGATLNRTIEASRDAIVLTDGEGRIRLFNAAAEATFRRSRASVTGQSAASVLLAEAAGTGAEAGAAAGAGPLAPFLDPGAFSQRGVWTGRRADGTEFPFEVQAVADFDREGQRICFLFLRDITDQRAVEAALHGARDSAERHAEARTRFLAVMSHEMRTPLNGVVAALDLMARGTLSRQQRRLLSLGMASGQSALRQVDDLLAYARTEDADRTGETAEAFDPAAVAEAIVAQHTPLAGSEGPPIDLVVEGEARGTLLGLRRSFERALGNLVSNAVKFGEGRHVVVRLARVPEGPDAVALTLRVTDQGAGIAAADHARIFEDFERLQPDAAPGTGLGLPIVRHAVAAMGGTLHLTSAPGAGSTFGFSVVMPRAPAAAAVLPAPVAQPQPVAAAGAGSGLEVLAAEDNTINRALLGEMLFRLGHRAHLAADGEAAVAAARGRHFDALVFDEGLPDITGSTALARIRAEGGPSAAAPALCVTAVAGPDELARLQSTGGFDAALAKPLRLDGLSQALAHLTAPPNDRLLTPAVVQDARDLLGAEGFSQLLARFEAETRAVLAAMSAGGGDAAADARRLHHAAGAASLIGAERLARMLLAGETEAREGQPLTPAGAEALLRVLELTVAALRARADPPRHDRPPRGDRAAPGATRPQAAAR